MAFGEYGCTTRFLIKHAMVISLSTAALDHSTIAKQIGFVLILLQLA